MVWRKTRERAQRISHGNNPLVECIKIQQDSVGQAESSSLFGATGSLGSRLSLSA